MAAPVGQARTQAGPPSIPLHMSHLMAFFGCFSILLLAASRHFDPGSPGPGPRPKRSHWTNDGFGGGTGSIRITPYGQLR